MAGSKEWHVAPIGGLRREGSWRFERDLVAVSLIGGTSIDLSDAIIANEAPTITHISLLGGCDIVVPPDVRVETKSFSLLGGAHQDLSDSPPADAPVLRIRSFSLIGGLKIRDL